MIFRFYRLFEGAITVFLHCLLLDEGSMLISGEDDYLSSPSARIVTGGLLRGGTGAFDLLVPKSYALNNGIEKELPF